MVKNKEIKGTEADEKSLKEDSLIVEPKKKNKKSGFKAFLYFIIFLAIVAGAVSLILKNPTLRSKVFGDFFQSYEEKIEKNLQNVESQVLTLQGDYSSLKENLNSDVDALLKRFNNLETSNSNVINSKADVALVLGIVQRLDALEARLNDVAKVSDNGALVATATMLVREAAERGSSFVYEMTVLEQLTHGETKIQPYVETLAKYQDGGIVTEAYLINEFNAIYSFEKLSLEEQQEEKDTDDFMKKFNSAFGKIMTIRYTDSKEIDAPNLEEVYVLVDAGDFSRAVFELQKDKYKSIVAKNEKLKKWIDDVQSREEFLSAISNISAYSLGLMKVNQLKR